MLVRDILVPGHFAFEVHKSKDVWVSVHFFPEKFHPGTFLTWVISVPGLKHFVSGKQNALGNKIWSTKDLHFVIPTHFASRSYIALELSQFSSMITNF